MRGSKKNHTHKPNGDDLTKNYKNNCEHLWNEKIEHWKLTTVEKFFIWFIFTVRNAVTGELIINTFSISTLKFWINIAGRIFSWREKKSIFHVITNIFDVITIVYFNLSHTNKLKFVYIKINEGQLFMEFLYKKIKRDEFIVLFSNFLCKCS